MNSPSSSLEPIETSVHFDGSYRKFLLNTISEEYQATLELYENIDQIEGTSKEKTLESCREFAHFAIDSETRRVHVIGSACRLRWCPICAKAKAKLISGAVKHYINKKTNAKFVTFTMKHNSKPLSAQLKHLTDSWREFRRYKFWKDGVAGGIWFLQVKKSKATGQWHPHLHVLINAEFMPQSLLSQAWELATQDSKIVDIRQVHNAEKVANYVARYVSRPSNLKDIAPLDRIELVTAMHGKRLFGKFGDAKNLAFKPILEKEKKTLVRLCSFSTVAKRMVSADIYSQLWTCWQEKKPLPVDWIYHAVIYAAGTPPASPLDNFTIDEVLNYAD